MEFKKELFIFEEWLECNSFWDEVRGFLLEAGKAFNVFLIEDAGEHCVTIFTNNDFTKTFTVDCEFEWVVVDTRVDETHWLIKDTVLIFSNRAFDFCVDWKVCCFSVDFAREHFEIWEEWASYLYLKSGPMKGVHLKWSVLIGDLILRYKGHRVNVCLTYYES